MQIRSVDLVPMNETLRADIIDALTSCGASCIHVDPWRCSVEQLLRRYAEGEGVLAIRAIDGIVTVTSGLFTGAYATPHRIGELRHYEDYPINLDDALESDIVRQNVGLPCPHLNTSPARAGTYSGGDGEQCTNCCAAYRVSSSSPWQTFEG